MPFIRTERRAHSVATPPRSLGPSGASRDTAVIRDTVRITNRHHESRHVDARTDKVANASSPKSTTTFGFSRKIVAVKKSLDNFFKKHGASSAGGEIASPLESPNSSFVDVPASSSQWPSVHTAIEKAETEIYKNRSVTDLRSVMHELNYFLQFPDAIGPELVDRLRQTIDAGNAELPKMFQQNNDPLALHRPLSDRAHQPDKKPRIGLTSLSSGNVKAMDDLGIHLEIAGVLLRTETRGLHARANDLAVKIHNLRTLLSEVRSRPNLASNSHLLKEAQGEIERFNAMRKSPSTRHEFKPPRKAPNLEAVRSNADRRAIQERPGAEHKSPDPIYTTLDWKDRPGRPYVRRQAAATDTIYATLKHDVRGTRKA